MEVIFNDSVVFTGTFEECKAYIVNNFTPFEFDADLIDIIEESGRCASFLLEWK